MLQSLTAIVPLIAQATEEASERTYAWSWAIILLGVVLGLVVALRPAKREDKVKVPKGP